MFFRAKVTFFDPELQSQYVAGMTYRVRVGTPLLQRKLPELVQLGLVEYIADPSVLAIATGTDAKPWWKRMLWL